VRRRRTHAAAPARRASPTAPRRRPGDPRTLACERAGQRLDLARPRSIADAIRGLSTKASAPCAAT
jgi:hypothetical protein